jgi:A/G-specific adenine glycosylase
MPANPFAAKLLDWYAQHKRNLPWRGNKDPYMIWLSEIILQQTRVEQGLPYFNTFMRLFPDVHALAISTEDQVLKAWEGLGYYSRARNLHKASKLVSGELNGVFPQDYNGLLALPGVGPYTAAAIASICFDEHVPVIDGNVNRFISRMMALETPVDTAKGKNTIHDELMPAIKGVDSPGEFNQALMEFGARHCVPRNPDCGNCTFKTFCIARKFDLVDTLPLKRTKVKVRERYINYHIALHEGKTFVRQRNEQGIWRGLFEFIFEERPAADTSYRSVVDGSIVTPLIQASYTHILSHQRIYACFIVYRVESAPKKEGLRKVGLSELSELALARITTRFLEENGPLIEAIVKG